MTTQYKCIAVENIRKVRPGLFLCDLQFETENGHKLVPTKNTVVDNSGNLEKYPENFLAEDASDEEWEKWQTVCKQGHPGYEVCNPEWLAQRLGSI